MANMSEFQLVSQALNARSLGDIQTARTILLELRRRNPTNPHGRLLSELRQSRICTTNFYGTNPTHISLNLLRCKIFW